MPNFIAKKYRYKLLNFFAIFFIKKTQILANFALQNCVQRVFCCLVKNMIENSSKTQHFFCRNRCFQCAA